MKKIFNFGKVDYEGRGEAYNKVTVEVKLKSKDGKKVFSACGNIWNGRDTDIICGGQCLDTIAKYIDDPTFKKIYRFWNLYHLNDMHPECEHQNAAGWGEIAKQEINLYNFSLDTNAYSEQRKIKDKSLQALSEGKVVTLSPDERFILDLELSIRTYEESLPVEIAEYYKPRKPIYAGDKGHVEVKTLGWLTESEHPDGILSKPCPVCGYKYGSSWVYMPIPEEDLSQIEELLKS